MTCSTEDDEGLSDIDKDVSCIRSYFYLIILRASQYKPQWNIYHLMTIRPTQISIRDLIGIFFGVPNHQLDLPIMEVFLRNWIVLTDWLSCIRWLSMFPNTCRASTCDPLFNWNFTIALGLYPMFSGHSNSSINALVLVAN